MKLGVLVAGGLMTACGPSLTTVHEGSVRFEHCYRLDLEQAASAQQRSACWSSWLGSYTYGQSRDRIEYARRRVADLAEQRGEQPELRIAGEQRPEQRQFYLVVPSPSSVHATPPPVATVYQPTEGVEESDAGSKAPENAKAPPAEKCATSCRSAWESCESGSAADAGAPNPKTSGGVCKEKYTKCMRGCFE